MGRSGFFGERHSFKRLHHLWCGGEDSLVRRLIPLTLGLFAALGDEISRECFVQRAEIVGRCGI